VVLAVPDNPDALLTREATSAALKLAGFPVETKTLATKASRGGGPPYRLFGRKPLYRWGDALAWAQARLSPPICSTSELEGNSPRGLGQMKRGSSSMLGAKTDRPSGQSEQGLDTDQRRIRDQLMKRT
jgi:hypothetical protein